eukprot:3284275-Pyramimonas_sp.AAC.1
MAKASPTKWENPMGDRMSMYCSSRLISHTLTRDGRRADHRQLIGRSRRRRRMRRRKEVREPRVANLGRGPTLRGDEELARVRREGRGGGRRRWRR